MCETTRDSSSQEKMRQNSLEEAHRIMDVDTRGNQPLSPLLIKLEILNLEWGATDEAKRSSYRLLNRLLHPDKVAVWHSGSEADQKICQEAYRRLDEFANTKNLTPCEADPPPEPPWSRRPQTTTPWGGEPRGGACPPCGVGDDPGRHPYGPDEAYVWLSQPRIWLCRLCGGKRGKECTADHLASAMHTNRIKSVMVDGDPYWLVNSTAPHHDFTAAAAA